MILSTVLGKKMKYVNEIVKVQKKYIRICGQTI